MTLEQLHALITQFSYYEISSGTLRPQDLLETFAQWVTQLDPDDENIADATTLLNDDKAGWPAFERDELNEEETEVLFIDTLTLVALLTNKLDDFSPEGFYFGTHPGDGSAFGWWEDDLIYDD